MTITTLFIPVEKKDKTRIASKEIPHGEDDPVNAVMFAAGSGSGSKEDVGDYAKQMAAMFPVMRAAMQMRLALPSLDAQELMKIAGDQIEQDRARRYPQGMPKDKQIQEASQERDLADKFTVNTKALMHGFPELSLKQAMAHVIRAELRR
jgi:hypothetical protein